MRYVLGPIEWIEVLLSCITVTLQCHGQKVALDLNKYV